ncbi:hypothetical protein [Humidisolicoccus flavus]|uniref:hypothetical protein n=1 Tax=Humidisolicoccus flavus TaxID=3111414 RepID=UPI003256388A
MINEQVIAELLAERIAEDPAVSELYLPVHHSVAARIAERARIGTAASIPEPRVQVKFDAAAMGLLVTVSLGGRATNPLPATLRRVADTITATVRTMHPEVHVRVQVRASSIDETRTPVATAQSAPNAEPLGASATISTTPDAAPSTV